jgi:quercetin dioxygenase-like cupin family protein
MAQETPMANPALPLDQVFCGNLLALAPIVPAANVSRALIDTPAVKVIVFAMDVGQAISSHSAPWPAIVQVIDGIMQVEVAGQAHTMSAGDWLLMPAGAPHALSATQPSRWQLTLLKAAVTG